MARRSTTFRSFSWPYFIIHLFLIAGIALAIVYFYPATHFVNALLLGVAVYIGWQVAAGSFLMVNHVRGMKLMRKKDYPGAIEAFAQSEQFLIANPWIDKYRCLVLLSASGISYREMALYNIAMGYSALGNVTQTRKTLTHFLEVAPRSPLGRHVRAALSTLPAQGQQQKPWPPNQGQQRKKKK